MDVPNSPRLTIFDIDTRPLAGYTYFMIKSFRHKGLKKLYDTGSQKGINSAHFKRLQLILARLDASLSSQDMNLPGLNLHPLKGQYEAFWSVSVSGNWRLIFRFEDNNAFDVDYLDYH